MSSFFLGGGTMKITINLTRDSAAIDAIYAALSAFNADKAGTVRRELPSKHHPEAFALIAADEEGHTRGGLAAHWEDDPRHVFVDYFHLDETLRGGGIGRRILEELFELAAAGGAQEVRLTTNTFQAPGFYLKMGFEITEENPAPLPLRPDNVHYGLRRTLKV